MRGAARRLFAELQLFKWTRIWLGPNSFSSLYHQDFLYRFLFSLYFLRNIQVLYIKPWNAVSEWRSLKVQAAIPRRAEGCGWFLILLYSNNLTRQVTWNTTHASRATRISQEPWKRSPWFSISIQVTRHDESWPLGIFRRARVFWHKMPISVYPQCFGKRTFPNNHKAQAFVEIDSNVIFWLHHQTKVNVTRWWLSCS